jgi:hypothetical protein
VCQTEKTEIKFQAGSTFGRPLNGLLACSFTDQISYTRAREITIRTELWTELSCASVPRFSSSGTDVCLEMLKRIFRNSSLTSLGARSYPPSSNRDSNHRYLASNE